MTRPTVFSRWLVCLLIGLISFAAQSATVNIEGYTAIGNYQGYPLYKIESTSIYVSSSAGSFDYVFIDDNKVAYNSSSYWSLYNLDINRYLDGQTHKLQLRQSNSDYGICYFTFTGQVVESNGISYMIIEAHTFA